MSSSSPLRALTHYKELPPIAGAANMIIALLARAPYAMLPLGIMTAFTASSGDLAVGGMAAGVFSIVVAVCSPLVGRASDYWGQRRVLLTLVPLNSAALLGLFWAASSGISGALLWLLCAGAGASVIPVGSFTRARWVWTAPHARALNAAFSYESTADELIFVLGPALVGIASSLAAPAAPLLLACVLMLTAGMAFALTAPKETPSTPGGDYQGGNRPRIVRVIWAVLPAALALMGIGTFFGATQAGTTARADLLGSGSQAGLVYAVMGLGSATAALFVVVLPDGFKPPWRFILFSAGAALSMVLVAEVSTLPETTWLLALSGLFVGPTMVTAFSTAQDLAPPGGIAVAMTLMQSSVTIGVSLGSSLGGTVAESGGAEPAFLLAAGASGLIMAVGLFLLLPRRKNGDPAGTQTGV